MTPELPPAVRPGDRVGIAALSGPVKGERLEAGLETLVRLGFEPVPAFNLGARSGLFAGSDDDRLDGFHRLAEGYICGDHVTVHVRVDGDTVAGVGFEGNGCAISKASASLMTESVAGRTLPAVEELFRKFHELLTGDPSVKERASRELGKLAVFEGVREFPVRVKCATLAWHTLQSALEDAADPASTE